MYETETRVTRRLTRKLQCSKVAYATDTHTRECMSAGSSHDLPQDRPPDSLLDVWGELTMSMSLLLALLGTHEVGEADRTADYFRWIGATPNTTAASGWTGGKPERAEIVMRALYDLLQSTIYPSTPEKIGTVLARALTSDTDKDLRGHDLEFFAKALRTSLRDKMITYLDELRNRYP
jgi:hypothetical protein